MTGVFYMIEKNFLERVDLIASPVVN